MPSPRTGVRKHVSFLARSRQGTVARAALNSDLTALSGTPRGLGSARAALARVAQASTLASALTPLLPAHTSPPDALFALPSAYRSLAVCPPPRRRGLREKPGGPLPCRAPLPARRLPWELPSSRGEGPSCRAAPGPLRRGLLPALPLPRVACSWVLRHSRLPADAETRRVGASEPARSFALPGALPPDIRGARAPACSGAARGPSFKRKLPLSRSRVAAPTCRVVLGHFVSDQRVRRSVQPGR